MRKSFQELPSITKTRRCTLPWTVFTSKNPDLESDEQFFKNDKKLSSLSEDIKNILASEITSQKIQQIGNKFNLELLQLADISRAIRSYYFGELKLEDFPTYFAKEIPIDIIKAQEITKIIINNIINDDSIERTYQANLEKLTLTDAIRVYPELGEQAITSDRIKILSFPEPVRPSIKNWITDYTSIFGQDNHNSIIRGNYLFHSSNAKKLNSTDRQKLSSILKSFDEKSLLTIDKNSKQIVFNRQTIPNAKAKPLEFAQEQSRFSLEGAQQAPTNKISFSSPQKLSYERKVSNFSQPIKSTPTITKPQINTNIQDRKTFGKNVVNLKELG